MTAPKKTPDTTSLNSSITGLWVFDIYAFDPRNSAPVGTKSMQFIFIHL